jgi:hypothetical protein
MTKEQSDESAWSSIGNDKEAKFLHGGKLVLIKPLGFSVPLFCEICKCPMRTIDDTLSYRIHQCCHYCAIQWADSAYFEWDKGWRPSQDQIIESTKGRNNLKPILFI